MKSYTKFVSEMTRKDQIDDVGRYHSARMGKSNPNADYHVVMRNRASRLKNMRDHTGPNPDQTKSSAGRKRLLKFASEDSRKAKKLKPSS